MIRLAMCHAISESATTELHPNKIGSKHNYTMNKGEMVIRTEDIANCPPVWTQRNDAEDAIIQVYTSACTCTGIYSRCFSHEID